MKRVSLLITALTLLIGSVGQASADVTYNFTYTDGAGDMGYYFLLDSRMLGRMVSLLTQERSP